MDGGRTTGLRAGVAAVARSAHARRLVAVRLTGQLADGVLQGALASFVLLSPERAATAGGIAAATAVLVAPFTLLGPWTGGLIDRFRRRQVLLVSGGLRALLALACAGAAAGAPGAVLAVAALGYLSVSRFGLAALSASLPRVVAARDLVAANAVVPTAGSATSLLGASLAVAGRGLLGGRGSSDAVDAALLVVAALLAGAGGLLALRLDARALGPDDAEDPRVQDGPHAPQAPTGPHAPGTATVPRHRAVHRWREATAAAGRAATDLAGVARHLRERPTAALALALIGADRLGYGVVTIAALLLARNHLGLSLASAGALAGSVLAVSGAGFAVAAVVTPAAVRRLGGRGWAAACCALAVAPPVALALAPRAGVLVVAAGVAGVAAQGLKVAVDTVVQTRVDDAFRGRVFVLYDALFNAVLVVAALVAALVLPDDGWSPPVLAALAAGWAALAAALAATRRRPTP